MELSSGISDSEVDVGSVDGSADGEIVSRNGESEGSSVFRG